MRDASITPSSIAPRCSALREYGIEFFAVATEQNLSRFDLEPFSVQLHPVPVLGSHRHEWDAEAFVKLFHIMDTHVFGGRDLTMPHWVLVDHALLSSGLVIAACPSDSFDRIGRDFELTSDARYVLTSLQGEAADLGFSGPIPLASYCAAPTADPRRRIGWSLCSVLPRSGLAFAVKALALAAYRATILSGTTQYDNVALRVHTKFGPVQILAAQMQLHTAPHTLVYQSDIQRWLESADEVTDTPTPTFLVSATDSERQSDMQAKIETGSHAFWILPPGLIVRDGERHVPVLETRRGSEGYGYGA